jgi:hypothetical protein
MQLSAQQSITPLYQNYNYKFKNSKIRGLNRITLVPLSFQILAYFVNFGLNFLAPNTRFQCAGSYWWLRTRRGRRRGETFRIGAAFLFVTNVTGAFNVRLLCSLKSILIVK